MVFKLSTGVFEGISHDTHVRSCKMKIKRNKFFREKKKTKLHNSKYNMTHATDINLYFGPILVHQQNETIDRQLPKNLLSSCYCFVRFPFFPDFTGRLQQYIYISAVHALKTALFFYCFTQNHKPIFI